MKSFATRHPLLFVLATTLAWILAGLVFVILASVGMDRPIGSGTVQSLGTLFATALLLFVTWRLGWLKAAGFTRLGGWRVWLLSLFIMLYIYLIYRYSFFGNIEPDLARLRTASAQSIILRQLVVGFVEEALFRGVLLYVLMRVWGGTRRGILVSALVTALLFGSMHILQLLTGNTVPSTLVVMLGATFSGIWLAALVLRWESVWPAVIIHAVGNMVVNIGALAIAGYAPQTIDFVQSAILEVPLVLWGLWLLMRLPLRSVASEMPAEEHSPEAPAGTVEAGRPNSIGSA